MIDSGFRRQRIDPLHRTDHLIATGWHPLSTVMPHLIFQIDEILRPIAEYVGQTSRPTAVEFARSCKAFEEPALRPLWESTTLGNLMYVLPKDVLYFGGPGICVVSLIPPCSLNQLKLKYRHVSADLPPTHPNRTSKAVSIRLMGQENHWIRNGGPGVLPPGPLQATLG